jgi:hypothetical protein
MIGDLMPGPRTAGRRARHASELDAICGEIAAGSNSSSRTSLLDKTLAEKAIMNSTNFGGRLRRVIGHADDDEAPSA